MAPPSMTKAKRRSPRSTSSFRASRRSTNRTSLDATNAFEFVVAEEERLAGLPAFARAAAKKSAEEKGLGGHRFTLHAPSFVPAITYLDDRSIREALYRGFNERASDGAFDNRENMRRILELRDKKARILGFASFADFATADRMARSGARVRAFVDDLKARTASHFERERSSLTAFAKETGYDAGPNGIEAWDVAYLVEKQRKRLYDFDEEAVRAHFPLEHVMQGLYRIFGALYGVRFEPIRVPVWDEAVRPYRMTARDEDGRVLATGLSVDLFRAREQSAGRVDGPASVEHAAEPAHRGRGRELHAADRRCAIAPRAPRSPNALPRVRAPPAPMLERGPDPAARGHERRVGFRRASEPDPRELGLGTRDARVAREAPRDWRADAG